MDGSTNNILSLLDGLENQNSERDCRRRTRGLPDEKARIQLARTYVISQTKHWPNLVKAGVLAKVPN